MFLNVSRFFESILPIAQKNVSVLGERDRIIDDNVERVSPPDNMYYHPPLIHFPPSIYFPNCVVVAGTKHKSH